MIGLVRDMCFLFLIVLVQLHGSSTLGITGACIEHLPMVSSTKRMCKQQGEDWAIICGLLAQPEADAI